MPNRFRWSRPNSLSLDPVLQWADAHRKRTGHRRGGTASNRIIRDKTVRGRIGSPDLGVNADSRWWLGFVAKE